MTSITGTSSPVCPLHNVYVPHRHWNLVSCGQRRAGNEPVYQPQWPPVRISWWSGAITRKGRARRSVIMQRWLWPISQYASRRIHYQCQRGGANRLRVACKPKPMPDDELIVLLLSEQNRLTVRHLFDILHFDAVWRAKEENLRLSAARHVTGVQARATHCSYIVGISHHEITTEPCDLHIPRNSNEIKYQRTLASYLDNVVDDQAINMEMLVGA